MYTNRDFCFGSFDQLVYLIRSVFGAQYMIDGNNMVPGLNVAAKKGALLGEARYQNATFGPTLQNKAKFIHAITFD